MRLAFLCYSLLCAAFVGHAAAAPIHPGLNTKLCLDVAGGSAADGTHVQIAQCFGNKAQDWQLIDGTLRAMGKCLDVPGGSTALGSPLQIWDCAAGNQNQQWSLSGGAIKWRGKNKCVDVPGGRAKDGQHVQTWTCNKAQAQAWQTALVPRGTPTDASSGAPAPAGGRSYTMVNQCKQPVWIAIQQNGGMQPLQPSGFRLDAGQSKSVNSPNAWGGRIWGRTGCKVTGASAICESGDAGGLLQPNGIGGQPSSLAEFTQDGWGGGADTQDYYDLSHVDAYNLPMAIYPQGGSGKCYAPTCKPDLLAHCPQDLQVRNGAGQTVTCLSSCTRYQTDDTCCRGAHNTSATCPPPEGARYFKTACPDAYSYAYDDLSSTFVCGHPAGYQVVFCPD